MARKKQPWFKRANPDPKVAQNVAGQAKPQRHNTTAINRLMIRIGDWERVMSQSKAPNQGSFHKPGSMKVYG